MLLIPALLLAKAPTFESTFDPGPNPLLMRHPTMNKTDIVFSYAGDLWSVSRSGGDAIRLTSSPGQELNPFFSPDGTMIAFTGQYDGNTDVFIMPAKGGEPKRLTYHPGGDAVMGWTPDGKSVLFMSAMQSGTDLPRLYTVSTNGGVPKALPLPSGSQGSYSPDGSKIAYVPGIKWEPAWKRYRGGQTYPIWIAQLSDSKVKEIPRSNTNDEQPMWVGDRIYYLSDKKGPVGLWCYDTGSGKETEEIAGGGFDLKSATAGPGGIVFEKFGTLGIYDAATKTAKRVNVEINGDFPEVRPQFKDLRPYIDGAALSPTGVRALVSARGWVFTVPASKGDARLVGEQQGVHRHDAIWSPDGKTIAYISDAKGSEQLELVDVAAGSSKFLPLGDIVKLYEWTAWSPDSTKIAYTDHARALWIVDVATGKNTKVDKTIFVNPLSGVTASWSPDSKWLTYARDTDSHMDAVFVYNLDAGKATQITDGLANAGSPVFDRDGKHLYFHASTNVGEAGSWLDLSSFNNPNVTSSIYAVVLRKDGANPLQPESDEETIKSAPPAGAAPGGPAGAAAGQAAAKPDFRIDLDSIEDRIIALPMPNAVYGQLVAGPPGSFFVAQSAPRANAFSGAPSTLVKFSLATRRAMPFAPGALGAVVSADGSKMLIQGLGGAQIVGTMAPPQPGEGAVDLSGLRVKIDPKAEWKQMFDEVWRNEPMMLYAPNLHGIDAQAMHQRYAPFLKNIASRGDLNYLFEDMTGEISIGHMWAQGGDIPGMRGGVPGGLLGCDFAFENGHYRLTRVYNGERWNPGLYAPLAQPGVNAKTGEYLLAIDGKPLADSNDIYETLEGKAGKQVKVKIGPTPDGVGAREVVVVPIPSEALLRERAWTEDNRRRVAEATGGKIGYVHVPDTNVGGWVEFNRYYFAQTGKQGIIVDERFNHGGLINDYAIAIMEKQLDGYFLPRYAKEWPTPGAAIYGPKVMLANQYSGSGGDMFPWLFKHRKIGPLVGKRTWGGLVAAQSMQLVDGGAVNAPDIAFYNPFNGTWDVEGHGTDPDIEVEVDPYLWRQGRDTQLEKAIAVIMDQLKSYPPLPNKKPAYPDKSKLPG